MKYIFPAKSYNVAFNFFSYVPNYSFSDFCKKKDVVLDEDQLLKIVNYNNKYCLIYFSINEISGYFSIKNTPEIMALNYPIEFEDKKSIKLKVFLDAVATILHWRSPLYAVLLFSILYTYLFIFFRFDIFPELKKIGHYVSEYCNRECVNYFVKPWVVLIFRSLNWLGIIGIVLAYLIYFKKNVKNNIRVMAINCSCITFLMFSSYNLSLDIYKGVKGNNLKRIQIGRKLIHNPKYFDNPVERKVASEILGRDLTNSKK